jgi:hypothetical protein
MNTRRISRSHCHHIDNIMSSDCSQKDDDSPLIVKDQSKNSYHQNNHNSGLIQHDELNKIGLRKRRTISNHHRLESLSSSTSLLILIRLIILLIFILIVYYTFVYIYSKPKQNKWERIWYTIIDWLMGE